MYAEVWCSTQAAGVIVNADKACLEKALSAEPGSTVSAMFQLSVRTMFVLMQK